MTIQFLSFSKKSKNSTNLLISQVYKNWKFVAPHVRNLERFLIFRITQNWKVQLLGKGLSRDRMEEY